MESSLFSILNRLSLKNIQSKSRISENLTGNPSGSRSFCSKRGVSSKTNLYSKISPLGSPSITLGPELDKWVESGKQVRVAELQRIIRDLRKRKRFTQALEVSEWMGNKGICAFAPRDHAVKLDLIGRVRGHVSAESYFNSMTDPDKTAKTYGALLSCYVRERVTDKSLSHMQKMKELGFASSPLSYNDLMCLYTNIGEYEKIPCVLTEMKRNGVSPDNFSYRICINSFGTRSNIDGMETVLREMENQPHIVMDWNTYAVVANFYIKASLTDKALATLKKTEEVIDKKDALCYNHLISLYASLGNKTEVMRLWELEKTSCKKVINRDYINMMSALVKLEEFEEAENLLREWESSGNVYDLHVPNILLLGYSQKGLAEKAEKMLKNRVEKGKVPTKNCWGIVAGGYLQNDNMENALRCMKTSLSLHDGSDGWRPNPKVLSKILRWVGDNSKLEEVEAFVGSMKTVIPVNREMYHALIKATMREGKEVDGLLENMKTDKIDQNNETEKILTPRPEKAE